MIDAIAERIAAFHAVALADDTVAANGSREGVWRVLSDNFTGARAFRDRDHPRSRRRPHPALLPRTSSIGMPTCFARRQRERPHP